MRMSSSHPGWLTSQPHPLAMWWPAPPHGWLAGHLWPFPFHTHTKRRPPLAHPLLVDGLILCGYGRGRHHWSLWWKRKGHREREGETPWPRGGRESPLGQGVAPWPPYMWPTSQI